MAQRVPRTLQEQKTCKTGKRNFRNGDIILLKAEVHRNHWPVACINETFADKHSVVRPVRLKIGSESNAQRELVRPITKTESHGLNQT